MIDAKAKDITEGLQYQRELKAKTYTLKEPEINEADLDFNDLFVKLLGAKNICSRRPVYNKYDKNVQGNTILEAGEADAGVIAPLLDMEGVSPEVQKTGVAVTTDGISRYSEISPYWQAADATVESMRNVAAVGATPAALTDCLNYNNPENPEMMWEFAEGVRGIADACKGIPLKDHPEHPTPIISGNVSLYNSVDSTAVLGCSGVIKDFNKAITPHLKKAGSTLFLLGQRKNELGAGEFYHLLGHLGANVPQADFEEARKEIYTVIDGIDAGLISACHDISEGGLLTAVAEMTMPHQRDGGGTLGVELDLTETGVDLAFHQKAFSETGGFVVEVAPENEEAFRALCQKYGLVPFGLGKVLQAADFTVREKGVTMISQPLSRMQESWLGSLRPILE